MCITYHIRYIDSFNTIAAYGVYKLNNIKATIKYCRDIEVIIEDSKQELLSNAIDCRFHGYTYTPYTKNSEI